MRGGEEGEIRGIRRRGKNNLIKRTLKKYESRDERREEKSKEDEPWERREER